MSARAAISAVLLAACAGRPPAPAPAPARWSGAPLRHVPAAASVVATTDLDRALAVTGLADAVAGALGADPATVGLDPHGPAGVVLLEPGSATVALFASAADPSAVLAAAERTTGPGSRRETSGEATILAGDRSTLVVRGATAIWIRSGARSRRDLWAVRIAGLAAADSLEAELAAAPFEPAGDWLIALDPDAMLPDTPLYAGLARVGRLLIAGGPGDRGLTLRGVAAARSPLLAGAAVPRLPGALASPPLAFGLTAGPEEAGALLTGWLADAGAGAAVRPDLTSGMIEVAFTERGPMVLVGSPDPAAAAALVAELPASVETLPDAVAVAAAPGLAERVTRSEPAAGPLSGPVAGYLVADGPVLAQLLPWPAPPTDELAYVGQEETEEVPASDEYRRIEARVLELQERHLALRVELERRRQRAAAALGTAIGSLVAVARLEDGTTRLEVVLPDADPAAAVAAWRQGASDHARLAAELVRLAGLHAEARRELIRVRLRDVTREQRRREDDAASPD